MSFRSLLIICLVCICALPSYAGKKWRTYEKCTLRENPSNDGDSFHVRYKKRRYLFRLYFVDTPETDKGLPDRIEDQARYWGISENDVIRLGKEAKKFTAKFLSKGFTAYSKLQDARGRSDRDRDYAMIETKEGDLSLALVENGLARVFGADTDLPNGKSAKSWWWKLQNAEHRAKQKKLGGWGMRKDISRIEQLRQRSGPAGDKPADSEATETSKKSEPAVQQAAAIRNIPRKDIMLFRTTAVYSLKDPTRQVGLLQAGADITVLGAESASMARVRFQGADGQTFEAQCRITDLGL